MFGLSLGKLLLLALVVLAVWYGFRYVQRIEDMRQALRRAWEQRDRAARAGGGRLASEELVKCRVCGVFVASGSAASCGRPDCPWRG